MNKIDWKRKLSSRKFWESVALFVFGLVVYFGGTPERAEATKGLIISGSAVIVYILSETVVDASYAGQHLAEKDEDE